MPPFMSDQDVAARVLQHIADGTTDRGTEVWREPVGNYRSPERLTREITRVLRRTPVPFCPSAAVPEAGAYVAREAAGTPLLVVRGRDGQVRAFLNACRHRGTQLASGVGCARSLVCPYHGWTYRLDGRLHHVPHRDGFPGLDDAPHDLVPVPVAEHGGLVFVTQAGDARAPAPTDGLDALVHPAQRLMDTREVEVPVNWKVFLEAFLEGYHIRATHPESFYPYGFDNLTIVEQCGRHSRVTFPFRRIAKLTDVPPAERRVDGLVTYVYHLFPNALVTVLSRHTNLVVIEPVTIDRTRLVTYVLTNPGDEAGGTEQAKRDAAFVSQTGAVEDLAVVTAIQRSIGSGANEHFTFGHFESAITHLHRMLDAAIADESSPI